MSATWWRRIAIGMGVLAVLLYWRGSFGRDPGRGGLTAEEWRAQARAAARSHRIGAAAEREPASAPPPVGRAVPADRAGDPPPEAAPDLLPLDPFAIASSFRPRPDDDFGSYRDRVVPIVQMAVAPQRRRVAAAREDFFEEAELTPGQIAAVEETFSEAAGNIADRVFRGVLSGELMQAQRKPTVGVAFVRDLLDEVDQASRRVEDTLSPQQRDILARSRFDVADYLLFATRWEAFLGAR